MKQIFFLLFFTIIIGCSKPKTVLICGDHICVNKAEAEQFFEENLSLEIRVLDQKNSNNVDLVELNLKSKDNESKKISLIKKNNTNKNIKILSNEEIRKKKEQIKDIQKTKAKNNKIKKEKTVIQKNIKKKKKIAKKIIKKEKVDIKKNKNIIKTDKTVVNPKKKITDICTILEKCSIDEISKYLIKKGKENKFPDITTRE